MRLLVDECTGPAVARWLRDQSHEVYSVYEESRGMADDDILDKAYRENWILITNDKDFGEKVYRTTTASWCDFSSASGRTRCFKDRSNRKTT